MDVNENGRELAASRPAPLVEVELGKGAGGLDSFSDMVHALRETSAEFRLDDTLTTNLGISSINTNPNSCSRL